MAAPSLTYTLTNGTTADAAQVMQDLNDLLNGITDGTKDLSISALTVAGTFLATGSSNTIGNSSSDDLTITASLASSIPVKTTASYDIGSSTLGLQSIYFGRNSQTVRVIGSASMSATWTLTLPTTAGSANGFLQTNGSGVTTWSAIDLADTDVTGTLPVVRGGTNNTSMLVTAGGIAYGTGAGLDVMAAAGTAGEWVMSGGTGAPTMSNTTTTAKAIIVSGVQLELASTASDTTNKTGTLGVRHYTNSEEPFGVFVASSTNTANELDIGGGSSAVNAATAIALRTAANNTTTSGTTRLGISSAGAITFPSISTTASAANAFLDSGASNNLLRSTSSLRYKQDVEDLVDSDALERLRPVTYRSRAEADDQSKRWLGFIAEEVHEIEPMLVHYRDGEPDGVQYDRVVVLLVAELRRLRQRVAKLEAI